MLVSAAMFLIYALLILAIGLVLAKPRLGHWPWRTCVALSWLLAWFVGYCDSLAILSLFLFAIAATLAGDKSHWPAGHSLSKAVVFALGFCLLVNKIPGFHDPNLLQDLRFASDSVTYNLVFDIGAASVGVVLLGVFLTPFSHAAAFWQLVKDIFPAALALSFMVLGGAYGIDLVNINVKLSAWLPVWILSNILFLCIPAEAFFRLCLQTWCAKKLNAANLPGMLSVLIVAVLYGFAHMRYGLAYMVISGCAGVGFGWLYYKTQRVEAAILAHIILNTAHFIFFSYPALIGVLAM